MEMGERDRARGNVMKMMKTTRSPTTRTLLPKCGVCSQLKAEHQAFSTPPSITPARGTPANRARSGSELSAHSEEEESLQIFRCKARWRTGGQQSVMARSKSKSKALASHIACVSFHLPFRHLSLSSLDRLPSIGIASLIMRVPSPCLLNLLRGAR